MSQVGRQLTSLEGKHVAIRKDQWDAAGEEALVKVIPGQRFPSTIEWPLPIEATVGGGRGG